MIELFVFLKQLRNVTQKKAIRAKCKVIYNGFDAEAWIKLDTDQTLKGIADHSFKEENNLTFCMITRNHPVKRNEAVFQYFCDTARSGSTLFVAGDFDDDTQQYWTDKSAGKIIFLGFLQVNEIRQVIEYCDAYISYSRSEGMSEALLQAAALSKILVLSTIPSFQEFSKIL